MHKRYLKQIAAISGATEASFEFNEVNVEENSAIMKELFGTVYRDFAVQSAESGCCEYIAKLASQGEIEFGVEDMIYDPSTPAELKYTGQSCKYKENSRISHVHSLSHNGKAKLLLADMQALFELLRGAKTATVLYIGAAPGNQTQLLAQIFSNVKFILFDKAPFNAALYDTKKYPNVEIVSDWFTDELIPKYVGVDIVISDVRLGVNKDRILAEVQIHNDMLMQQNWVRGLKPAMGAMLKFRPPYLLKDMPPEIPTPSEYTYLAGKIFWQAFPHIQSTEGRLLLTAEQAVTEPVHFDYEHYESAALQHNYRRVWCTYKPDGDDKIDIPGFDRCLDCTYLFHEIRRFGIIQYTDAILEQIGGLIGCCDMSPAMPEPRVSIHGYFQKETRFQKHLRFIKLFDMFLYRYRQVLDEA